MAAVMEQGIVIETSLAPPVTVVMLHGYAMQPEELAPFVHSMGVPGRFLLLRGPKVAWPSGRAWWSVDTEVRAADQAAGARDLAFSDPPGRAEVRQQLAEILRLERARDPSRPCVLAGFSQGGMLACDTLLYEDVSVDGLALLSSSCIDFNGWHPRRAKLQGLKAMVAHGRHDADLAFSAGERLRDLLMDSGASIAWVPFDGGHQIPLPVWRALRRLIRSFAASPSDPATAAHIGEGFAPAPPI